MRKTIILMAIVGSLLGAVLVGAVGAANSSPPNYCNSGQTLASGKSGSGCCPSGSQGNKDQRDGDGHRGCCVPETHGDKPGRNDSDDNRCCVVPSRGHHNDHDKDDRGKHHSDSDDKGCDD